MESLYQSVSVMMPIALTGSLLAGGAIALRGAMTSNDGMFKGGMVMMAYVFAAWLAVG